METLEYTEKGKVITVLLEGSINITNVEQIEEQISALMGKKPKVVGLDCNELKYIDSSAIAVFVKLLKNSMTMGIKLIFFNLNSEIEQTFHVIKLSSFFKIMSKDQFDKEYGSGFVF